MGTFTPGLNNWSGTDHYTATRTPFGGIPELVQSTSMVYTPTGCTGRVDVYLPKLQTFYIPVYPTVPTSEQTIVAGSLITPELKEYADVLCNEFKIITRGEERDEFTQRAPRSAFYTSYADDDILLEAWQEGYDTATEEIDATEFLKRRIPQPQSIRPILCRFPLFVKGIFMLLFCEETSMAKRYSIKKTGTPKRACP
jgi:hypothetical protein